MKGITSYIIEATAEFKTKINNLKFEKEEPKSNQEDYVKISTYGRTWKDNGPIMYVKVEDLQYTDREKVLSVAYNLMKREYREGTSSEISTWDPEEKQYISFAIATLQKKNRMWHPEWIKSNKYNFK